MYKKRIKHQKSKNWFFEKINETDRPLGQRKKGPKLTTSEMKRETL